MPYSDLVTATPEAQLSCLLNFCLPGCGTMFSAFYKKGGVCMKTFGIGFLMNFLHFFFMTCYGILFPLIGISWIVLVPCQIAVFCWAQFHSFLTWKVSRETYHC
jgi:hypothetical protein